MLVKNVSIRRLEFLSVRDVSPVVNAFVEGNDVSIVVNGVISHDRDKPTTRIVAWSVESLKAAIEDLRDIIAAVEQVPLEGEVKQG